jgi:putative ABC transport system permease protein
VKLLKSLAITTRSLLTNKLRSALSKLRAITKRSFLIKKWRSLLKSLAVTKRSLLAGRLRSALLEALTIAVRSLMANRLRSALTMLGIIIGVGAVITLMSVGEGAQAAITSTFEQMGTNVLYVMSTSSEEGGMMAVQYGQMTPNLTLDDAEALESIPSVTAVASVNENYVEVTAGGENKTAIIHGATPEYQEVYKYPVASGEFFSNRDVALRNTVVVLGSQVAEDLFGDEDPIVQRVKIKGKRFDIIGVLEPKGGAIMGISMDDIVVTPITTFQTRLFTQQTARGEDAVQSIALTVASADAIDDVRGEVEDILRYRHRIDADEDDDFTVVSMEQMLGQLQQVLGIFTIVLGAIASISLLVGGIGIMNIMLVSVTERTREIGIRKAVGAKRRDILIQFLLEAAVLSLLGGAIGIIGGWMLAFLISLIDIGGTNLHSVVSLNIVILAVTVSVIIGLASGVYPALRAAKLNPIDALRYG